MSPAMEALRLRVRHYEQMRRDAKTDGDRNAFDIALVTVVETMGFVRIAEKRRSEITGREGRGTN